VIKAGIQRKLNEKAQFFLSFNLTKNVTMQTINRLMYYLMDKKYRRRDVVFREGDKSEGIYFIREGEY